MSSFFSFLPSSLSHFYPTYLLCPFLLLSVLSYFSLFSLYPFFPLPFFIPRLFPSSSLLITLSYFLTSFHPSPLLHFKCQKQRCNMRIAASQLTSSYSVRLILYLQRRLTNTWTHTAYYITWLTPTDSLTYMVPSCYVNAKQQSSLIKFLIHQTLPRLTKYN